MNLDLENKIVLFTGATGGIGRQAVMDLLKEGAKVVCLIRNEAKMEELRAWLSQAKVHDDSLFSMNCNLLDFEDIVRAVNQTVDEHKRIDVLVNCAGHVDEYPFALLDKHQIDKMIDLNFKTPLYLTHAVLRTMFRQKEGSIINISSASAVKKGRGIATYAASKAAMDAFSRALSQEIGRKNIRINSIRPGIIDTNMSEAVRDRSKSMIEDFTALGRTGIPEEVSRAILFLASNKTASYITGESINIDGGLY